MRYPSLALQPIVAAVLCTGLQAADFAREAALPGETIAGAVLAPNGRLLTWGTSLTEWTLPSLRWQRLAEGPFGEGGCLADLDANGQAEFVAVRGAGLGDLVWLRPPGGHAEIIDSHIETHDCLEATLFGRRGILIIHRGAQVRFYQRGAPGKWTSRDIYSIYTPSYQGGLALADVDGDGRTDILCGNYWIRSPERFDHAWRLFAINTWFEHERSATMRLLVLPGGRLAVAQSHESPGRVAIFSKPADPRNQWPADATGEFTRPHGFAWWNGDLLIGENNGAASRLLHRGQVIASGQPAVALVPLDASAFVLVGPERVGLWRQDSSRK